MPPRIIQPKTPPISPVILPVNSLSPADRSAFLERLAAAAAEGRMNLENDFGLAPIIGELAVAVKYNLLLHPAGSPAADAVDQENGNLKYSIKTIHPSLTAAPFSWSTSIEKSGMFDMLSVVALDAHYKPSQILTASRTEIQDVLNSRTRDTKDQPNRKTISYPAMLSASLRWLRGQIHSSGKSKSRLEPGQSWYLDMARGEDFPIDVAILRLGSAVHANLDDALRLGMVRVSISEPYLTVEQVAKILSVDAETVRRYARKRVLTTVAIPGGSIRFDPKVLADEINQYVRPSKFRKDK